MQADQTKQEAPNRIIETFRDQTLLVTGGTGFLGKVFIEKLLRVCPEVKKVYTMIRTKRGKDAETRASELFANPLYDLLKKTRGEGILRKVIPIPGDVAEHDLALSREHRQAIMKEVNIIVHLAATVRFDDTLKQAVFLNTRGTKLMLELARQCTKLSVFVHVSTAYCHSPKQILYEKTYPPPADPHHVIEAVETLEDKVLEKLTEEFLENSANTYTLTKALGEELVREQMDKLPVVILRPPVVIPVLNDPIPGWTDNLNGPTGLLVAAGKGVMRSLYCNSTVYAEFVPVDAAANHIMLAAYDYTAHKSRRVYNCTSYVDAKVTWGDIIEMGRRIVETRLPLNGVVWYPGGSIKTSRTLHNICVILFHYLPAIILDSLIFLTGNKPVLWRVQQRLTKGCKVYEYFANNQWKFDNYQMRQAESLLTDAEREALPMYGKDVDIDEYFYKCTHAARLYLLNETDDTIPAARVHMNRMWYLDKGCKTLIVLSFFFLVWHFWLGDFFDVIF